MGFFDMCKRKKAVEHKSAPRPPSAHRSALRRHSPSFPSRSRIPATAVKRSNDPTIAKKHSHPSKSKSGQKTKHHSSNDGSIKDKLQDLTKNLADAAKEKLPIDHRKKSSAKTSKKSGSSKNKERKKEDKKPSDKSGKSPSSKPKKEKNENNRSSPREKYRSTNGIPPPGNTVYPSLLQLDDSSKKQAKKKMPPPTPFVYARIADPKHPQQQLIVSSYVTGGRRVKRWTYTDSYPAGQFPPPRLGALLSARPACSRQDCGLTVMEAIKKPRKDASSASGKNKKKERDGSKKSNSSLRRRVCRIEGKRVVCEERIVSPTLSCTISETSNINRRLSEEAVRAKLIQGYRLIKEAADKMKEVRRREKDDTIYKTSLQKTTTCKKQVDELIRGLSAIEKLDKKNQSK